MICTGSSCRSVMLEALMNYLGQDRIKAFLAGSHPIGRINADALAALKRHDLPTEGYQSQFWEDFEDTPIFRIPDLAENYLIPYIPHL